jgi:4-hydroxyphenylpyruvate dioxygenase
VQHIALHTDDILESIKRMKARGCQFLSIPGSYYDLLETRLAEVGLKVEEDMKIIRELNLLCDFDAKGYLLQIFTKPLEDRPTFFVEII